MPFRFSPRLLFFVREYHVRLGNTEPFYVREDGGPTACGQARRRTRGGCFHLKIPFQFIGGDQCLCLQALQEHTRT